MYRFIIFSICIIVGFAGVVRSQEPAVDPYPDFQEDVFMDMDFSDNLITPKVPAELQKSVSAYMEKIAKGLKHRYTIDLTRNNDVFIIVVPTDDLFLPNDTLFSAEAVKTLDPILDLMKDPYMYKVVVAVHTDDTGSEEYRMSLSTARIYTVYDWLMERIDAGRIPEEIVIIPYAMGSTEPLVSNDTRKHRKENRRLEFYFIPGPKMLDKAKSKTLK